MALKKIISFLLIFMLIFGTFPVFAAEKESPSIIGQQVSDSQTQNSYEEKTNAAETTDEGVMPDTGEEAEDEEEPVEEAPVEETQDDETQGEEAQDEEAPDDEELSPKEAYLEKVKACMDNFQQGDWLFIEAASRKEHIYIDKKNGVGNRINLTEESRDAMYSFLAGLYNVIQETMSKEIKDVWKLQDELQAEKDPLDYYCRINVGSTKNNYVLTLTDNYLNSFWVEGYVEDPEKIISFIADAARNDLTEEVSPYRYRREIVYDVKNIDLDAGTYKGEPYQLVETLTFEVTNDDAYYDTIFDEIASSGSVIKGSIDQINTTGDDIFVLTLTGDEGEEIYYSHITGLGFSSYNGNNTLTFKSTDRYDGQNMIYDNRSFKTDTITFKGTSSGQDIADIDITLDLQGYGEISIPTSDVSYNFYGDMSDIEGKRNLAVLFGIERTPVDTGDDEYDPEHSVTNMRSVYSDGKEVIDFYIGFVAEMPIDIETSAGPEWYQDLGSDVSATLLGITQTLNGNDRLHYTMVRFSGSKGTKWFDMGSSAPCDTLLKGDYTSDQPLTVDMTYHSLLSFEGFTKIRNTVEYDTLDLIMQFENNGELTLDSLKFTIGTKTAVVPEEDINYVGGGRPVYEKLW